MLTREQIEAEGWVYTSGTMEGFDLFEKQIDENKYYELAYREEGRRENWIEFSLYKERGEKWEKLYKGNCKDVNTLRMLEKLLKTN